MSVVVDASAVLSLALPNEVQASQVAAALAGIKHVVVPDVFFAECAHGIIRAARRGLITTSAADVAFAHILTRFTSSQPTSALAGRAWEIASVLNLGAYDAHYLALAEAHGCVLLTTDESLIRAINGTPLEKLAVLASA